MTFDFAYLEPQIRGILSAPGTDLSTISAKRVRRQLLELDDSLSAEFLKENKDAVDAVIARVFEQVSNDHGAGGGDGYPEEGEGAEGEQEDMEEEDVKPSASSKKQSTTTTNATKKASSKKKSSQELSDAELARRLSSEINARSTRTGSRPTKPSKKTARTKKSSATVDSDDSDGDGSVKRTRKKTGASGSAKGGFAKEFLLSAPLATLLQVDKLSRPQVVKQLWVHIKGNELQNPDNKREIICDDAMKAVFGVDKIDMFKMNQVLGQHLHENEG